MASSDDGVFVSVIGEAVFFGVPWRQHVRIALAQEGVPLSGRRLRLVSSRAPDACTRHGLEGITGSGGRFAGTRWQWSSAFSLVDVVVQDDALCLLSPQGTCVRAWALPYGPAPDVFTLTCDFPVTIEPVTSWSTSGPCQLAEGRRSANESEGGAR